MADAGIGGIGGIGGTITIEAANGTLTLSNNKIAIAADGGAGGNQSGTGGKGGNSTSDGGDVRQAGNGGDGGTITIEATNTSKIMAILKAATSAKGGVRGAQTGTGGGRGEAPTPGKIGTVDQSAIDDMNLHIRIKYLL